MQSERATALTHDQLRGDPLAEHPPSRPDLRVVRNARSRRLLRGFGIATAVLVAAGGYVHYCLYRHGYRTIPKIGVGFLLQAVTSVAVVLALLMGPHLLAPVVICSRIRFAGAVFAAGGAGHWHPGRVRAESHARWSVQLPGTRPPTRTASADRAGRRDRRARRRRSIGGGRPCAAAGGGPGPAARVTPRRIPGVMDVTAPRYPSVVPHGRRAVVNGTACVDG